MNYTRPVLLEMEPVDKPDKADDTATLEQITMALERIETLLASRQREVNLLESINTSLNTYTLNIILSLFFLLAFGTLALYFFSDQFSSMLIILRNLPLVS